MNLWRLKLWRDVVCVVSRRELIQWCHTLAPEGPWKPNCTQCPWVYSRHKMMMLDHPRELEQP